MRLKFSDERITEFYEAGFHKKNDGHAFDVSAKHGSELLQAVHILDGRRVNIFALAEEGEAQAENADPEPAAEASAADDTAAETEEEETDEEEDN